MPNDGNITIAELLDMRSGLYNYTNAPEFAASLDRDMKNACMLGPIARCSVRAEANFAPGAEYEYCNTNYILLGLIIEKTQSEYGPRRAAYDLKKLRAKISSDAPPDA